MSEQSPERSDIQAQPEQAKAGKPAEQPSQDELRARYLEQQRRMRCVGCGEGEEFF